MHAGETTREAVRHEAQDEILRRMDGAGNYNAWLLDRARPYLGRRVLDLGAGTGTFTRMVAPGRERVVALEPDAGFAARLRDEFADYPNVAVLELDATEADPEALGAPFDSVVCFNVLEHVADDEAALGRIRALLAPGGHLLLVVPAHPLLYGSVDEVVDHKRRYRKEDVRRRLERARFEVESVRLVNPVGAVGWLVSSRLLRRPSIPEGPLRLYDRLVPVLRALERVELPFGLSVWAVARRSDGSAG